MTTLKFTKQPKGRKQLAALIATHNRALAAKMDRVVRLDHGKLVAG